MNTESFDKYVASPALVHELSLESFDEFLHHFPYCTSLQILKLKKLQLDKNLSFNKQLKKTAIAAHDRKRLFDIIFKEKISDTIEKIEREIIEEQVPEAEDSTTQLSTVDLEQLQEKRKFLEKEIVREAISSSIALNPQLINESTNQAKEEEKEEIVKPKALSANTKLSFSNWLKVLSDNDSISDASQVNTREKAKTQLKANELIDTFIKNEPQIKPKKEFFSPQNIAKLNLIEDENFVTETLAKIYMKQGHYHKAIKAYEHLSLKFPKKNTYFAALILEAKEKINQQKKQ
jgi:hypothetical protein